MGFLAVLLALGFMIGAAVSDVPRAVAEDDVAEAWGSLTGEVRERATSRPLAGAIVYLGGHPDTTSARGRFQFPKLATGVYRLVVAGACDSLATLVEMRPGEAQSITVIADTACAPASRLLRQDRLPTGVRRESLRAARIRGGPAAGEPSPYPAIGEVLEDGTWERVVAAPPPVPGPLGALAAFTLDPPPKDADAVPDWIALIDPGCFGREPQFTLTASGAFRARLLGPALMAPGLPVLERQLCAGCVLAFFDELKASRIDTLSGAFAGPEPTGGPPHTLGGVVGRKPFLVRVSGARLALVEALKARALDLAAYRGCSDPSAILAYDVEIALEAPDSVVAGREFEVRATLTSAGDPVIGIVAALDVEGAMPVSGDPTFSGNLDPGDPHRMAARFRFPTESARVPGDFARTRLQVAVERGFLRHGGERTHPIRIVSRR